MNKIKQIFLTLSLISMAATVSVSAMENNSEQSIIAQSVASTCWNALSDVKNVTQYGISIVAAEARCIPEAINGVFTHIAKRDKEQNGVNLGINSVNLNVYQVLATIQNGAYYGANYAHSMINDLFTHIASGDE